MELRSLSDKIIQRFRVGDKIVVTCKNPHRQEPCFSSDYPVFGWEGVIKSVFGHHEGYAEYAISWTDLKGYQYQGDLVYDWQIDYIRKDWDEPENK